MPKLSASAVIDLNTRASAPRKNWVLDHERWPSPVSARHRYGAVLACGRRSRKSERERALEATVAGLQQKVADLIRYIATEHVGASVSQLDRVLRLPERQDLPETALSLEEIQRMLASDE